ncbi:hypothetical protein ACO0QE_001099 [Hanseniaspora vineae]
MQFSTVAFFSLAAIATAESVAVVSQIGDGQIQATTSTETPLPSTVSTVSTTETPQTYNGTTVSTQSSNGAAKYGAGAMAGVVAAGAALLF